MEQMSWTLAAELCGVKVETPLLQAICAAEETRWSKKLPQGMTAAECGSAFLCAVAFSAAAHYMTAQMAGEPASFTAGEVTVKGRSAAEQATLAKELRYAADRLMAPYLGTSHICFKGVTG